MTISDRENAPTLWARSVTGHFVTVSAPSAASARQRKLSRRLDSAIRIDWRFAGLPIGTTLLATVVIWAVSLGLGCKPEKPQGRSGASPAPTPTVNQGSSPDNPVLSLDGKTAPVRVPDSPSLHSLTNAMTLEVWFKAASFYKRDGAVNSLLRKNVEAGGENFFLRFRIMGGKPAIEMSCGNQIMQAPYDFQPGTWYHLAGTYDGKAMTVFVNGFSNPIEIDDSDLIIGKGDPQFSFGEYFDEELGSASIVPTIPGNR